MIRIGLFIISIILIIYGYVARLLPVYFFWESKDIGWPLLLLTIILFLLKRVKRLRGSSKTILEKALIIIISCILLFQTIFLINVTNHDAVKAVKAYVADNDEVISEVGPLRGIYAVPQGNISNIKQKNGQTLGEAQLVIILKGDKKYKEVNFFVRKEPGSSRWKVISPYWY